MDAPVSPTPWETVVSSPPAVATAPFSAPKMEDLSYALAQAVHEEVMALGAGAPVPPPLDGDCPGRALSASNMAI